MRAQEKVDGYCCLRTVDKSNMEFVVSCHLKVVFQRAPLSQLEIPSVVQTLVLSCLKLVPKSAVRSNVTEGICSFMSSQSCLTKNFILATLDPQ